MSKNYELHHGRSPYIAFGLLFFLLLASYSNSFNSSWHLDDEANIIANRRLHINALTPDSIMGTFYASPVASGKMFRPVANLTFALNWHVGQDHVTGYHIVNIAIHLVAAFLLYLTIVDLCRTPKLQQKSDATTACFIAFLAAALWAANPIQTQAVTYIVQRMALLAALFCLLSMFCYIRFRLSDSASHRILHLAGSILSFVLAVGSKENAVLLPLVLILVEMTFFRDLSVLTGRRLLLGLAVGSGILIFLAGSLLFMKSDLLFFLKGYAARPFSLSERILTEPRIIVYYLSQIFYPLPDRLSIQHDILISTSLLKPWTTLPSIALVLLLIGGGISQIQKRPIAAFGILFFFLNHLVESTIIPLELIFEHRNYLPSLFLFWPISDGIKRLIDYYRKRKRSLHVIIASFGVLLILVFGFGSYIRNMAWATEKSLWEDAAQKAPQSSRPIYRLAAYYAKVEQLDLSAALLQKGFTLRHHLPDQGRVLYYNNMGNIFRKKQTYGKAVQYFETALEIHPNFKTVRENLLLALIESSQWDRASKQVGILLTGRNPNSSYFKLKGIIWIRQHSPAKALPYFRKALLRAPNAPDSLLNFGAALSLTGSFDQADGLLSKANSLYPNDTRILLWLIENNLKAGHKNEAGEYLDELLTAYGTDRLLYFLRQNAQNNFTIPLSSKLLLTAIIDKSGAEGDEIADMTFMLRDM
ncbi:MAG: tetratricopeptide repeat protein [bacterium]|nr:tetratricopeptide repeat protein [bacterium]